MAVRGLWLVIIDRLEIWFESKKVLQELGGRPLLYWEGILLGGRDKVLKEESSLG